MKDWIYMENKIIGTKNKYLNFQVGWDKNSRSIFYFFCHFSKKTDHAGFNFQLDIFNFYFIFQIYDNRHWCDKCSAFKTETCDEYNHDDYED